MTSLLAEQGELLKLGFEIAESTVFKYMIRRRGPQSQTWRTFLRNHAEAIAETDLCVGPTLTFECLFAFLVVGPHRRQLLWFAVTRHPRQDQSYDLRFERNEFRMLAQRVASASHPSSTNNPTNWPKRLISALIVMPRWRGDA
jgi:hypothetical protein